MPANTAQPVLCVWDSNSKQKSCQLHWRGWQNSSLSSVPGNQVLSWYWPVLMNFFVKFSWVILLLMFDFTCGLSFLVPYLLVTFSIFWMAHALFLSPFTSWMPSPPMVAVSLLSWTPQPSTGRHLQPVPLPPPLMSLVLLAFSRWFACYQPRIFPFPVSAGSMVWFVSHGVFPLDGSFCECAGTSGC